MSLSACLSRAHFGGLFIILHKKCLILIRSEFSFLFSLFSPASKHLDIKRSSYKKVRNNHKENSLCSTLQFNTVKVVKKKMESFQLLIYLKNRTVKFCINLKSFVVRLCAVLFCYFILLQVYKGKIGVFFI